MPKFSATSAKAFRTVSANVGRMARGTPFVVICEADDGSWFELDADDLPHGERLARNQVDLMACRGACVWSVDDDGILARRPSYDYFPG